MREVEDPVVIDVAEACIVNVPAEIILMDARESNPADVAPVVVPENDPVGDKAKEIEYGPRVFSAVVPALL